jgi:hypothetical protein
MDNAEKKLGTWTLPKEDDKKKSLAQEPKKPAASQKKSDPICPSSGCPEPKKNAEYPIDYKVPDFGQDHDIKDSLKHMDSTEKKLGTWTLPPKNETENSLAVKKDDKKALTVTVKKSDPICPSVGCESEQRENEKKNQKPDFYLPPQ